MDNYKKIKTNIKGLTIKNGSYFLKKRFNGKTLARAIGREDLISKQQAEDKALNIIRKVEEVGLEAYKALQFTSVSSAIGHNQITTRDVLQELVEHGQRYGTKKTNNRAWRKSTIENYSKKHMNRWTNLLDLPIASITKDHIRQEHLRWLDNQWNGKDAITSADDALRILSRIFNWAVGKDYIPFNPCASILQSEQRVKPNPQKEDEDKRLSISTGELGQFLGALIAYSPRQNKRSDTTARDLIVFALLTGARRQEIFNVQWSWFNDNNTFAYFESPKELDSKTFEGTKSRYKYYYPCSMLIQEMMKARFKNRHNLVKANGGKASLKYVFPNNIGTGAVTSVKKYLASVLKFAGLGHRSLHDFRRTFEDVCEQETLDGITFEDRVIKRAIHHKSSDITFELYAMSAPDKTQLHRVYQHVEDFCSMSLGGGTMTDIFGEATTYSATVGVSLDNVTKLDDRASTKNELRLALYNEEYDYKYPIPSEEFAEQEKQKIKERLGLDEDAEFDKWTKDKTASNDLSDWVNRWNKMLDEALEKYKNNKN